MPESVVGKPERLGEHPRLIGVERLHAGDERASIAHHRHHAFAGRDCCSHRLAFVVRLSTASANPRIDLGELELPEPADLVRRYAAGLDPAGTQVLHGAQ